LRIKTHLERQLIFQKDLAQLANGFVLPACGTRHSVTVPSRTTKQADSSSTNHGGGKRRLGMIGYYFGGSRDGHGSGALTIDRTCGKCPLLTQTADIGDDEELDFGALRQPLSKGSMTVVVEGLRNVARVTDTRVKG
jgi:hypothetical protein